MLLALQTHLSHLGAVHLLGHAQSDLGLALGNLTVHDELELARPPMQVQRPIKNQNGEFFVRPEVLDDGGDVVMSRIDFFGHMDDFVGNFSLALFQEASETFWHEALLNHKFAD